MPSTIDTLEDDIIKKLTDDAGLDIDVEKFPSRPDRYVLTHSCGVVLVAYPGSRFQDFGTAGELRVADIMFTVLLRNMRDHEESYAHLEKVVDTMRGYVPSGFSPMLIESETFVGEHEGVWQYDIKAKTTGLISRDKVNC